MKLLEKRFKIFEMVEEKLKGSLGFIIDRLDRLQKGNDSILAKINYLEKKLENQQRDFNHSLRNLERDLSRPAHSNPPNPPKLIPKKDEPKTPPVKDLFGNNVPTSHENIPKAGGYVKGSCKVWGCDNPADQSGYCSKHFHVYRKR